MCRLFHLMWLTVLTLANGSAAPVPEEGVTPISYFPNKAGAEWVYTGGGTEECVVLSGVAIKGEATILTFLTQVKKDGKATPREKLTLTDKGIFRIEFRGKAIDPPLCLLKLPAAKGLKWEESDGEESKTIYTVVGPEDVEVPAGKYKAIRVELEMWITFKNGSKLEKPYRQTNWYAPRVGCVKQVAGEAVKELKSFTSGKN